MIDPSKTDRTSNFFLPYEGWPSRRRFASNKIGRSNPCDQLSFCYSLRCFKPSSTHPTSISISTHSVRKVSTETRRRTSSPVTPISQRNFAVGRWRINATKAALSRRHSE
ncbi:hypothetical protein SCHPADRAFT_213822 [Schizopora paradoxa]|uniref:Uncharacterized protein n=1 Tax=Schizopora paradoxa TaxID=27342 RepID=A0A0H2S422_9AGAM|nr:hypothetical protein SCHPADRAFT_213822 [Schizopora paradoxa]